MSSGRTYTVRVRRSDREYVDPVCIRAESRHEAEAFAREMFGERLVSIVKAGVREREGARP